MGHARPPEAVRLERRIRVLVACFIAGLVLSGVTAFPLLHELNLLVRVLGADGALAGWVLRVRDALAATYRDYAFLGYGTDWLAFGHLVIALFFVGVWRDPVRNIFTLHAGLIACAGVIPLALICGPIRGIPFYWQLIDCSFGVFGAIPLWWTLRLTRRLEAIRAQ
ncbi:MAG: hypothetical protein ABIZ56_06455 [Chthoniobacteraceae bacterium]